MSRTLKAAINAANPANVPVGLQVAKAGTLLGLIPRRVRAAVVAHTLVLPDAAKAAAVLSAFSIAGTLTGRLAGGSSATPATGNAGVSLSGDIRFATADAVTSAEVVYLAAEGDVITDTLTVDSDSATLLGGRAAHTIIRVESIEGTTLGALTVAARGAAPGAGAASQSLAGTVVSFNASDAVTAANVTYIATPGVGSAPIGLGENLDEGVAW